MNFNKILSEITRSGIDIYDENGIRLVFCKNCGSVYVPEVVNTEGLRKEVHKNTQEYSLSFRKGDPYVVFINVCKSREKECDPEERVELVRLDGPHKISMITEEKTSRDKKKSTDDNEKVKKV